MGIVCLPIGSNPDPDPDPNPDPNPDPDLDPNLDPNPDPNPDLDQVSIESRLCKGEERFSF